MRILFLHVTVLFFITDTVVVVVMGILAFTRDAIHHCLGTMGVGAGVIHGMGAGGIHGSGGLVNGRVGGNGRSMTTGPRGTTVGVAITGSRIRIGITIGGIGSGTHLQGLSEGLETGQGFHRGRMGMVIRAIGGFNGFTFSRPTTPTPSSTCIPSTTNNNGMIPRSTTR